jgi:proteasome lid subunit RPN8/RPN11
VLWVRVYDGRPESVLRRTAERSAKKLAGARILLLGCGGLGAPIAEHCVRSGASRVHIVDSGTVSPGVLSRQPYEDADIGKPKAKVLASRLGRIRPESKVIGSVADIVRSDIFSGSHLGQYDLIIDATANRSVAAKIERAQRDKNDPWPTLVTVAISQQATHGVAAVTPRGTAGAGVDLLRRLGLRTCMSTALGDVYTAFFPPQAERLNFRPDTSCSGTTFIGSTTDIGALAAQLLDSALARLDLRPDAIGTGPPHRSVSIVRLGSGDDLKAARVVLDLPPDRVVMDHRQTYEVRVDETAMETIREHVRASVNGRTSGAGHTGGLLLGQFDGACRIAWVSQATGLPPGSTASPLNIALDADEVRDFLDNRSSRSGGMLALIGFWHTHLGGSVAPSETDRTTMQELVASAEWPSARALLLVLGVPGDGSTCEPTSPWVPEIHAETFTV